MVGLLASRSFIEAHGPAVERVATGVGQTIEWIAVPADPEQRVPAEALPRIGAAFFSPDLLSDGGTARRFFGAATRAPELRWFHGSNAGMDGPVFTDLVGRGVQVTSSAGASATPIAQSAIAGLLALARGLPHWMDAQRRRAWEPRTGDAPPDLDRQTLVVVGLGSIGNEISRLAGAIGLHTVGVHRSPRRDGYHVDELHPPEALPELLPRADWLALACPLTEQTEGLIDAEALSLLPDGAHLINIARGQIVREAALTERLRGGLLAGAYLDVFEVEPLPEDSPLWELPNVIISPHNSGSSAGTAGRVLEQFLENLGRWLREEPLHNVYRPTGG